MKITLKNFDTERMAEIESEAGKIPKDVAEWLDKPNLFNEEEEESLKIKAHPFLEKRVYGVTPRSASKSFKTHDSLSAFLEALGGID